MFFARSASFLEISRSARAATVMLVSATGCTRVRRQRPVLQRVGRVAHLRQVALGELVGVDDDVGPARQVGQVRLERRRVHRHQDVRRVTGGEDVGVGEVHLEAGDAGQGPGRRPDLGREVGERGDVVAELGGLRGEPVTGELHAVAGVAGEPDDHPIQLPDLLGHVELTSSRWRRRRTSGGPGPAAAAASTPCPVRSVFLLLRPYVARADRPSGVRLSGNLGPDVRHITAYSTWSTSLVTWSPGRSRGAIAGHRPPRAARIRSIRVGCGRGGLPRLVRDAGPVAGRRSALPGGGFRGQPGAAPGPARPGRQARSRPTSAAWIRSAATGRRPRSGTTSTPTSS